MVHDLDREIGAVAHEANALCPKAATGSSIRHQTLVSFTCPRQASRSFRTSSSCSRMSSAKCGDPCRKPSDDLKAPRALPAWGSMTRSVGHFGVVGREQLWFPTASVAQT